MTPAAAEECVVHFVPLQALIEIVHAIKDVAEELLVVGLHDVHRSLVLPDAGPGLEQTGPESAMATMAPVEDPFAEHGSIQHLGHWNPGRGNLPGLWRCLEGLLLGVEVDYPDVYRRGWSRPRA